MVKTRIKKFLSTVLIVGLFSSTIVYGATGTFNFSLSRGQSKNTGTVKKESKLSYATVERTGPSGTQTYVYFTMLNDYGVQKSDTVRVKGITSAHVNYYKLANGASAVNKGDTVKLKGYNPPGENSGVSIVASGRWIP